MKKTLATIAAMAMAFALCSCGNTADSEPTAAQPDSSVAASTALDDDSEASQAGSSGSSDSSSAEVTTTPKADDPSEESTEKADGGKTTTAKNNSSNKTTTAKNSSGKTTTAAKNNSSGKTTTAAKNSSKTTTAKKATTPAAPSPAPETTTPAPATTTTTTTATTTTTTTPAPQISDEELAQQYINEVFRLTNEERIKAGLQPLELDPLLCEIADKRAKELVAGLTHDGLTAYLLEYKIFDKGISENIAGGQTTPSEVVNDWMSSEGHKRNILGAGSINIGIGYYRYYNEQYNYYCSYWVQIFSREDV